MYFFLCPGTLSLLSPFLAVRKSVTVVEKVKRGLV